MITDAIGLGARILTLTRVRRACPPRPTYPVAATEYWCVNAFRRFLALHVFDGGIPPAFVLIVQASDVFGSSAAEPSVATASPPPSPLTRPSQAFSAGLPSPPPSAPSSPLPSSCPKPPAPSSFPP